MRRGATQVRTPAEQRKPPLEVPPVAVVHASTPPVAWADPLQRGRNVALMPEAELRSYALQVGVPHRDAQGLGVEQLRANCLLTIDQRMAALIDD